MKLHILGVSTGPRQLVGPVFLCQETGRTFQTGQALARLSA